MTDGQDDDEALQLPADTLALLQNFNREKEERAKQFDSLRQQAENRFETGNEKLSMDLFGEDWNASQFWYTDETARRLANQLLSGAGKECAIAVVSAPSVYVQLHNILADREDDDKPTICLLEYDKRFEIVGKNFVYYDFEMPLHLPAGLKGRFDRIICDPPFLSEDCQTKTALTVRHLSRGWTPATLKLISCTGERMEQHMLKIYGSPGLRTTSFEPEHSKGLSNEFRCYANFECTDWKWRSN